MTILTGPEIVRRRAAGDITIEPFDEALVNPVSYNYRLGATLKVNRSYVIDSAMDQQLEEFDIPEGGYVLHPGIVYLGTTVETIGAKRNVISLIGRSSLGRLGCFVQYNADLSQTGALHRWTLELKVVQPLRVYAGMKIGQVSFREVQGEVVPYGGHLGFIDEATTTPPERLLAAAGH